LRTQKPTLGKELKVWDYHLRCKPDAFEGDLGDIRDVIIYEGCDQMAVLGLVEGISECAYLQQQQTVVRRFYEIPREWCKRIIGRRNKRDETFLHLLPFEFCCRQILKAEGCAIVQCRSITIEHRYYLDKTFFHVGCGPCFDDTHDVYKDVELFVGLKRLCAAMKKYGKPSCGTNVGADMIYVLGLCRYNLPYHYFVGDQHGVLHIDYKYYSGQELKQLLKHILVCCKCVKYLESFLDKLFRCVISYHKPQTNERNSVFDPHLLYYNGIECVRYILDGNFDIMLECAYDAPHESLNLATKIEVQEDICGELVDVFMYKYI
jgi:hypothetical protein